MTTKWNLFQRKYEEKNVCTVVRIISFKNYMPILYIFRVCRMYVIIFHMPTQIATHGHVLKDCHGSENEDNAPAEIRAILWLEFGLWIINITDPLYFVFIICLACYINTTHTIYIHTCSQALASHFIVSSRNDGNNLRENELLILSSIIVRNEQRCNSSLLLLHLDDLCWYINIPISCLNLLIIAFIKKKMLRGENSLSAP